MTKNLILPTELVVQMMELLSPVVVSFDRIGSRYANDPETGNRVVLDFLDDFDVVESLAEIRKMLTEVMDQQLPASEVEELEERINRCEIWQPKDTAATGS